MHQLKHEKTLQTYLHPALFPLHPLPSCYGEFCVLELCKMTKRTAKWQIEQDAVEKSLEV